MTVETIQKILKRGNEYYVIIPAELLAEISADVGDEVIIMINRIDHKKTTDNNSN